MFSTAQSYNTLVNRRRSLEIADAGGVPEQTLAGLQAHESGVESIEGLARPVLTPLTEIVCLQPRNILTFGCLLSRRRVPRSGVCDLETDTSYENWTSPAGHLRLDRW